MKKLTIILLICFTVLGQSQPIIDTSVVKIDDQTCEITTTTKTVVRHDRAELQTELDHIPDRLTELQKQIDAVNDRKTELINILKVFN